MANFRGISAGYPDAPSKDKAKKAEVNFNAGIKTTKGASWKGKESCDGAKPKERQAIIKPSNIHDIKSDRKNVMGKAPGK